MKGSKILLVVLATLAFVGCSETVPPGYTGKKLRQQVYFLKSTQWVNTG